MILSVTANGCDCWGVNSSGLLTAVLIRATRVDPDGGGFCDQLRSRSRGNPCREQPLACPTDSAELLTPTLESEPFWVGRRSRSHNPLLRICVLWAFYLAGPWPVKGMSSRPRGVTAPKTAVPNRAAAGRFFILE